MTMTKQNTECQFRPITRALRQGRSEIFHKIQWTSLGGPSSSSMAFPAGGFEWLSQPVSPATFGADKDAVDVFLEAPSVDLFSVAGSVVADGVAEPLDAIFFHGFPDVPYEMNVVSVAGLHRAEHDISGSDARYAGDDGV